MEHTFNFMYINLNYTVGEDLRVTYNGQIFEPIQFEHFCNALKYYYLALMLVAIDLHMRDLKVSCYLTRKRSLMKIKCEFELTPNGYLYEDKIYTDIHKLICNIRELETDKAMLCKYYFFGQGCTRLSCNFSHYLNEVNIPYICLKKNKHRLNKKIQKSRKFIKNGLCEDMVFRECRNREKCEKCHKLKRKYFDEYELKIIERVHKFAN